VNHFTYNGKNGNALGGRPSQRIDQLSLKVSRSDDAAGRILPREAQKELAEIAFEIGRKAQGRRISRDA
jgi:hypothetical protein